MTTRRVSFQNKFIHGYRDLRGGLQNRWLSIDKIRREGRATLSSRTGSTRVGRSITPIGDREHGKDRQSALENQRTNHTEHISFHPASPCPANQPQTTSPSALRRRIFGGRNRVKAVLRTAPRFPPPTRSDGTVSDGENLLPLPAGGRISEYLY
ncbi:hypothetical protein Hypma_004073 [Hypsizygus marmoreus]|uniref:Uncharacterized protein n=1 Tax=Hypsizygus marmoreus TaxID=39966 RepID=A0A369J0P5_HYPMA|nr:hypothetical protein Hypma_004073 [Hypsizygus marmoreus]